MFVVDSVSCLRHALVGPQVLTVSTYRSSHAHHHKSTIYSPNSKVTVSLGYMLSPCNPIILNVLSNLGFLSSSCHFVTGFFLHPLHRLARINPQRFNSIINSLWPLDSPRLVCISNQNNSIRLLSTQFRHFRSLIHPIPITPPLPLSYTLQLHSLLANLIRPHSSLKKSSSH